MTAIESAAFADSSAHWISSFSYDENGLTLAIHPSTNARAIVTLAFARVSGMRIDASYNGGEFVLPWDIIGFESKALSNDRWEFVLHTDAAEFTFTSAWPDIQRVQTSGGRRVRGPDA
jgi:hypothetical protein